MDDLRESLQKAENQTREKMNNLNEVLKHIKLAQHALDLEEGEELEQADPNDEGTLGPTAREALIPMGKAERKWGAEPSELEVKATTRYEKGTLSTCIVNVLKRMGEPGDSRKIHEELVKGGWKSDSKDGLGAVRNGLVRLKGSIKSEKVNGIFHYSLLPIKELV